MEKNNKEIDLIELFIKVLLHVKKYKWILIASIVIGFSVAYTISKFSTKLYKSHITVITNDEKGVLVSLFKSLSEEQSISNISNSLNVSNDISKSIIEIELEIIALESEKDMEPSLLKIYVTVTDSSVFKDVEKGLQYYAENNSYLKMLDQINNSQRNELINYIDIEINKLDSLRMLKHKKNTFYVEDNAEASKQTVSLFSEKQKLEKENEISKVFNIIEDFEKGNKPINNFLKIVVTSVFLTVLFGFIFTILLELRILLRKRDEV